METSSNHNEYLEGSSHDSHRNDTAIFGADFMVHSMLDPKSFLSKYHAAVVHEPTCNEQCLTTCGDICQTCSPLCGFLGCANCCCLYMLPTATGTPPPTQPDSPKPSATSAASSNQASTSSTPAPKKCG